MKKKEDADEEEDEWESEEDDFPQIKLEDLLSELKIEDKDEKDEKD